MSSSLFQNIVHMYTYIFSELNQHISSLGTYLNIHSMYCFIYNNDHVLNTCIQQQNREETYINKVSRFMPPPACSPQHITKYSS